MYLTEATIEVRRIPKPHPPSNRLYRKIGVGQQQSRLYHPTFGDPLADRSARPLPHHCGQMTGRHPHRLGYIPGGQLLREMLFDHTERIRQHRLLPMP